LKYFLEAIMPNMIVTPAKAASVSIRMSLAEAVLPVVNIW